MRVYKGFGKYVRKSVHRGDGVGGRGELGRRQEQGENSETLTRDLLPVLGGVYLVVEEMGGSGI